jgi:hypothetical protein
VSHFFQRHLGLPGRNFSIVVSMLDGVKDWL